MDSKDSWLGSIFGAVGEQIRIDADHLPRLLAAILILMLGWVIARVARSATRRLALASNRLLERAFPSGVLAEARVSSLVATLLGTVVFWATLLIAITIAARFAELSSVSGWLDRITTNLPNLVAAVTIVIAGYFLSVYVREQVAPLKSRGTATSQLLGRVTQVFVIAVALIVGLDQVGIDVVLLTALTVVFSAALLAGLAVAFALGARSHVSNLVGAQTARKTMSPGVRIRIDDIEGEVLEIGSTQIALDTDHGKVLVPGKYIDEHPTTIMAPDLQQEQQDV